MQPVIQRQWGRAFVAIVICFCFASFAGAKVGNPDLIPAHNAYVVSIPDVAAFWQAWKANAIYATYKKVMDTPEIASGMQQFNKQLQTIEGALGFPLNGDSMSQIFKSADIYVRPGEQAGQVVSGVILGIKDRQKLDKMIDLAEKAAKTAASRVERSSDQTTGSEGADTSDAAASSKPAGAAASPITSEDYKGVQLKKFAGSEGKEMYYAIAGDLFLGSNSNAELKSLVDATKAGAKAGFGSSDVYKKLEAGATEPAEVYVYVDAKLALELQKLPPNMEQFQKLLSNVTAGVNSSVTTLKFDPKDVKMHTFGPIDPAQQSAMVGLFTKNPPTKPLEILGFAPANALIVFATNLVDAKVYYDVIAGFYATVSGQQVSDVDKQMEGLESQLGFSLKNDFLPALGNEFAFMLNSVKMGGGIPSVDVALAMRIADKAKMQKVLDALEKRVGAQMAAMSSASSEESKKPQQKPGFKSESAGGGATIKYVEVPNVPSYTPGYVITGDYLLIGTTRDALKNLIGLKSGKGDVLTASAAFKQLGPKISANTNVLQYMNFGGIWDTAAAVMQMIPAAQGASQIIDALRVFKTFAGVKYAKDNAIISDGVLQLQ